MTKFRTLSTEELRPLKKEFIAFLSANTITGKDWALIKKNKPKEAEKIIDLFSDTVWQTTLDKICCLERREEKQLCIFLCEKIRFSWWFFNKYKKRTLFLILKLLTNWLPGS